MSGGDEDQHLSFQSVSDPLTTGKVKALYGLRSGHV